MMSLFLYRFPFTLLFLFRFRFRFQFRFRFLFPFPLPVPVPLPIPDSGFWLFQTPDKLTQLKKSQTVSKNRKISKIPVVVLFIDHFPKNLNNSPPDRGLATPHTNKIFAAT